MLDWKKHYLKFVAAAAINAAIFATYRIYIYKLKNKISKLSSEHEELINKLRGDLNPVLIKDFSLPANQKLIEKFNFIEDEDDLAPLKIALFDYKGYIFALRKYAIHDRQEYTLLTETSKINNDGLSVETLCKEFFAKMKLTKVPVVWQSQYFDQFQEKKEVKPKVRRRIRVKIEKEIKLPEEK